MTTPVGQAESWDDLKRLIREKKVIAVVGSGVSRAAVPGAEAAGWVGLLKTGVRRCYEFNPALGERWQKGCLDNLELDDLDTLLGVGELVRKKLPAGEFGGWLRRTVGALTLSPQHRELLDAIRDLEVPLLTTNYDGLLEEVTGRPPVTLDDRSEVLRWLRGDSRGILHLHGHWDTPESVVLGVMDYAGILGDELGQSGLRALALSKSLLFLGCGDGLRDPNFEQFLKWLGRVNEHNEDRHYRLARNSEVAELQRGHPAEQRIVVRGYGPNHGDLAGCLRRLAPSRLPKPPPPADDGNRPVVPVEPELPPPVAVRAYLQRLREECQYLRLIGVGPGIKAQIPIQEAYVPLRAMIQRVLAPAKLAPDRLGEEERGQLERNVEVAGVFRPGEGGEVRRVVLLGDPGSGKTTAALQFCWHLLRADSGAGLPGLAPGTIPVLLRLRRLTPELLKRGLRAFIEACVAAPDAPADTANPGPGLLDRPRVLWVFDGLDEVATDPDRETVCRWIDDFLRQRPDDRVLVTSRYSGYQGKVDLGPEFNLYHVQALDESQVKQFIEQWYRAVYRRLNISAADAEDQRRAGARAIRREH